MRFTRRNWHYISRFASAIALAYWHHTLWGQTSGLRARTYKDSFAGCRSILSFHPLWVHPLPLLLLVPYFTLHPYTMEEMAVLALILILLLSHLLRRHWWYYMQLNLLLTPFWVAGTSLYAIKPSLNLTVSQWYTQGVNPLKSVK